MAATDVRNRSGRFAALLGAIGLLLAGCSGGDPGKTYPLSYEETYGKLYGMSMMREVCQQDYGIGESNVRMDERGADTISWIVSSGRGEDWYRLTAKLQRAPEGQTGTTVALNTKTILKDNGFGNTGGLNPMNEFEAMTMFREKVDSTLQGRPFEFRRVAAAVDAYLGYPTPSNPNQRVENVQDVGPHMDRYAIDSRRQDNPPRNKPGEKAIC
jgi:hypothetical protein